MLTTAESVTDASSNVRYALDHLVDHGPPGVEGHLIAAEVQLRAVAALLYIAANS